MKHSRKLVILLLGSALPIAAQDALVRKSEFRSELSRISITVKALRRSNEELQKTASAQKQQIESLSKQLSESQANIRKLADSTSVTVADISSRNEVTQGHIEDINRAISERTVYSIIIFVSVGFLGIVSLVVLRRRLSSSKRDFEMEIATAKGALAKLENDANRHDSELAGVLAAQLGLLKESRSSGDWNFESISHKLPLKVGDEVHRMRKRIENMPQDVKGLGALLNSLSRLEEEFNENGYEIENLIGKKFDPGMNLEARFVEDPTVPAGEEIIVDVLRPQIMFRNKMIQHAKVEVGKSF